MNVGPRISPDAGLDLEAARRLEQRKAGTQRDAAANAASRPAAGDRVELSQTARAKAHAASLPGEQLDAIRTRISDGTYNDLRVVDAVARRILASGDL